MRQDATTDTAAGEPRSSGLTTSWLAASMGLQPAHVEALRRQGALLGIRLGSTGEHLYPSWQFGDDGKPLPGTARVVQAARAAGLSDDDLYRLLRQRVGLGGDTYLCDHLRAGREDFVLARIAAMR